MLCLTYMVLTTLKYARVRLAFFHTEGGGGGGGEATFYVGVVHPRRMYFEKNS